MRCCALAVMPLGAAGTLVSEDMAPEGSYRGHGAHGTGAAAAPPLVLSGIPPLWPLIGMPQSCFVRALVESPMSFALTSST